MNSTTPGLTYGDKTYNYIKWFVQIALPAAATLYFALGNVWGFPNVEAVVASITAITTFLGITLGISSHNYNKSDTGVEHPDGIINIDEKPNGSLLFDLMLNQNPEDLTDKTKVVFNVVKKKNP